MPAIYLPFVLRQESPPTLTPTPTATVTVVPTTVVICRFSSPLPIPDNDPDGLNHTINLNYPGVIVDLAR